MNESFGIPEYAVGELESFWTESLIFSDDEEGFFSLFNKVLKGQSSSGTFRLYSLKELYQWTKIQLQPIKDKNDNVQYIIGHMEMTMQHKENAAKEDFLSRMSHEMRTPLNAIIGLTELARNKLENKEFVSDCLKKTDIASKHLLSLINDTLDMSKLNSGKLILQRKPFDLKHLLKTITIVYDMMAKQAGVVLKTDFPKEYSTNVVGDEIHLKQILINLLSNAIKYNREDGEVDLKVEERKSFRENAKCFRFTVSDTGYGIHEKDLSNIFCSFEKAESSSYKVMGTGLGLAISQQLAALMGSIIEVESIPDIGSRFWIDIELETYDKDTDEWITQEHERQEMSYNHVDLSGKRYLLFEDNPLNSEVAVAILKEVHAEVDVAVNGKVGCDLFRASEEHYYNAIIMDIRMPVMNGYEATEVIRNMDRRDSDILIVAMSANSFAEDVQRALMIGMDEYCTKPIISKHLFRILQEKS